MIFCEGNHAENGIFQQRVVVRLSLKQSRLHEPLVKAGFGRECITRVMVADGAVVPSIMICKLLVTRGEDSIDFSLEDRLVEGNLIGIYGGGDSWGRCCLRGRHERYGENEDGMKDGIGQILERVWVEIHLVKVSLILLYLINCGIDIALPGNLDNKPYLQELHLQLETTTYQWKLTTP
ncbi:hypothetical protein Tco_0672091 [Tanacetum coccineum]